MQSIQSKNTRPMLTFVNASHVPGWDVNRFYSCCFLPLHTPRGCRVVHTCNRQTCTYGLTTMHAWSALPESLVPKTHNVETQAVWNTPILWTQLHDSIHFGMIPTLIHASAHASRQNVTTVGYDAKVQILLVVLYETIESLLHFNGNGHHDNTRTWVWCDWVSFRPIKFDRGGICA